MKSPFGVIQITFSFYTLPLGSDVQSYLTIASDVQPYCRG